MAALIFVNGAYRNTDALDNLINYIMNYDKTRGAIGGQGVYLEDPYTCMEQVQRYYGKEKGKLAQHIILSFDAGEYLSDSEALEIGYRICALLPEYQILFGVHHDTPNLHIHFGINPVNISTGKKLHFYFKNEYTLESQIGEILAEYGLNCQLYCDEYKKPFYA